MPGASQSYSVVGSCDVAFSQSVLQQPLLLLLLKSVEFDDDATTSIRKLIN